MLFQLLLLFITVPLIELAVLLRVGAAIGPIPTFGLVILTGIAGAALARSQGFAILKKIQTELANHRMPASELIDGLLILIGGIVLLTPGILTDILGFSLMIPHVRRRWKKLIKNRFQLVMTAQNKPPIPKQNRNDDYDDVIDV